MFVADWPGRKPAGKGLGYYSEVSSTTCAELHVSLIVRAATGAVHEFTVPSTRDTTGDSEVVLLVSESRDRILVCRAQCRIKRAQRARKHAPHDAQEKKTNAYFFPFTLCVFHK